MKIVSTQDAPTVVDEDGDIRGSVMSLDAIVDHLEDTAVVMTETSPPGTPRESRTDHVRRLH